MSSTSTPNTGCIINGHVPVKVSKGERPIKANGKLIVIDGGFSKAYQRETGIAGYTLIANSRGMLLAAHQPFESTQRAVSEELDIDTETEIIYTHPFRMRVSDTDRAAKSKGTSMICRPCSTLTAKAQSRNTVSTSIETVREPHSERRHRRLRLCHQDLSCAVGGWRAGLKLAAISVATRPWC